jgi:hypothetical protein
VRKTWTPPRQSQREALLTNQDIADIRAALKKRPAWIRRQTLSKPGSGSIGPLMIGVRLSRARQIGEGWLSFWFFSRGRFLFLFFSYWRGFFINI